MRRGLVGASAARGSLAVGAVTWRLCVAPQRHRYRTRAQGVASGLQNAS